MRRPKRCIHLPGVGPGCSPCFSSNACSRPRLPVQSLQGKNPVCGFPSVPAALQGQGLMDLGRVEIFVLEEAARMLDVGFIPAVRGVLAWNSALSARSHTGRLSESSKA